MLRVVFRLEAGPCVGLGHLTRSLSLARELTSRYGATVIVITGDPDRRVFDSWRGEGFEVLGLHSGDEETALLRTVADLRPDVLVIDRLYDFSVVLIEALEALCPTVMIHGVGEGVFHASLVIFPNAHMDDRVLEDSRWRASRACVRWGWEYVLMKDDVLSLRGIAKPVFPPHVVGILGGGSDPAGVIERILPVLQIEESRCRFVGFTGEENQRPAAVAPRSSPGGGELRPFDWREIVQCDAVVSSFGVSAYEAIFLGLPLITVGHAEANHVAGARLARRFEINDHWGLLQDLTDDVIRQRWNAWTNTDPMVISARAAAGRSRIDAKGTQRCAMDIAALPRGHYL